MKTRIIILMAIAMVTVGMVSCEKSETNTFRVTIKPMRSTGNEKLSRGKTTWAVDDQININGDIKTVRKDASNNYVIPAGSPNGGNYYAVYPASISGTGPTYNISDGQTELPMFAYANTTGGSLSFSTPYAMIVLTVINSTGEDLTGGRLTFEDFDIAFGSNHDVDLSSGSPIISNPNAGGTFSFGPISDDDGSGTFEYYIIPNNRANVPTYIECTTNNPYSYGKETTHSYTFRPGYIYPITVTILSTDR